MNLSIPAYNNYHVQPKMSVIIFKKFGFNGTSFSKVNCMNTFNLLRYDPAFNLFSALTFHRVKSMNKMVFV